MIKRILIALGMLVLSFGIFLVYVLLSFEGTPWGKWSAGREAKAYAAEKYGMEMEVEKGTYNFKEGTYGAKLHPQDDPALSFYVSLEHGQDKEQAYWDTYHEALWTKEVVDVVHPLVEQNFGAVKVLDIQVAPTRTVYAKGEHPRYQEINSTEHQYSIFIKTPYDFPSDQTDAELHKALSLVLRLQEEHWLFGNLVILYNPPDEGPMNNASLRIEAKELGTIHTLEEIRATLQNELHADAAKEDLVLFAADQIEWDQVDTMPYHDLTKKIGEKGDDQHDDKTDTA